MMVPPILIFFISLVTIVSKALHESQVIPMEFLYVFSGLLSTYSKLNKSVERYRSPPSGATVTTFLPAPNS